MVWLPRQQVTSHPCLHRALATPPIPGPHWSCVVVSMVTPLCLLPGLPLVRTHFSHLLSGRWHSGTVARGTSHVPAPPAHRLPLPMFPPRKSGQQRPASSKAVHLGLFSEQTLGLSLLSPAHREGGQIPAPSPCAPAPCLAQRVSLIWPALPCPSDPEKGLSAPAGLVSLLDCCSLTCVTLWHLACSAL